MLAVDCPLVYVLWLDSQTSGESGWQSPKSVLRGCNGFWVESVGRLLETRLDKESGAQILVLVGSSTIDSMVKTRIGEVGGDISIPALAVWYIERLPERLGRAYRRGCLGYWDERRDNHKIDI